MTPSTPIQSGVVKLSVARLAYERLQTTSDKESLPFQSVMGLENLEKVSSYQNRLLATKLESATGHMFINGKHYPFSNVRVICLPKLTYSIGQISFRTS
jgi:hypothetical protein